MAFSSGGFGGGGFGGTPNAFAKPAGAFGAPAASPFGAPAATPAFGAPGGASPFGASQPSAFGAPAAGASPFGGGSSLQPQGSVFGGGGGIGAVNTQATNNACRFWNKGSCRFGQGCRNSHVCSKCGSSAHKAINCSMVQGAGGYRVTRVTDKELLTTNQNYAMVHSISAMQENQHKSVEEIRFEAYATAGDPAVPGASPGGAFGQSAGSGTSAFGASPTPGFGASSGGGLFGAPSSQLGGAAPGGAFGAPAGGSSPFGAAAPTNAFGASTGAANPFGASSGGGAFGSAVPAGGGAFGASPLAGASGGGLFGSGTPTGGAFGAPSNAPGAFGAAASPPSAFGGSPAVGAAAGGLFGATSPTAGAFGGAGQANPFGASTPAFGAAASTTAFGAASSTPAFGAVASSTPAFGGAGAAFGAPASTPAFGGSPLGGGGAFGTPAPSTPAFGAPASTPAFGGTGSGLGGFGGPSSTPAFGAPASSPAFGAAPTAGAPAFGAAPSSASPFGAPSTTSAPLFGAAASSTPAFGAGGGGLFGSSAPAPASTPAFGAAPASTPAFGGGFGASTPAASSGGLFGASTGGAGLSLTPAAGSTPAFSFASAASGPAAGGGLFGAASRPAATPAFGAGLTSTPSLFGGASAATSGIGAAPTTPVFGPGAPAAGASPGILGSATGISSFAIAGGAAGALPNVNTSPYGGSLAIPAPAASPSLSGPPPQKKSLLGSASPANVNVAFPVRSLTPRSPWLTARGGLTPRMKPRGKSASPSPGCGDYSGARPASANGGGTPSQMADAGNWMFKPRDNPRNLFIRPEPSASSPGALLVAMSPSNMRSVDRIHDADGYSSGHRSTVRKHSSTPERRHVHFEDEAVDGSPLTKRNGTDAKNHNATEMNEKGTGEHALPVISTDEGYSMEPSREVLQMLMEEKGEQILASVEDFVVSRENYGSVKWLEPVDVRNLDIERVVRIERGVVYVYHENSGVPSPPAGEGLKKRAEVTLYECRPKKSGEAARAKFEERVLKQTRRMGGDLLEYNADTGVWRFALQL